LPTQLVVIKTQSGATFIQSHRKIEILEKDVEIQHRACRLSPIMPSLSCQLRLGSSFEEVTSTLGLDPTNTSDVRIYHLMLVPYRSNFHSNDGTRDTDVDRQHEVGKGRQRLVQNKDALLPQFKQSPLAQPPYHRTHIDFKAFLRETKAIHLSACPETRARYDKASGPDDSNAAISWLLWQALRGGEQNGYDKHPSS